MLALFMALCVRSETPAGAPATEVTPIELPHFMWLLILLHQRCEHLMSQLDGSAFNARDKICTLGTFLVECAASFECIISQDLLNADLDLVDSIRVGLAMPD